MTPEELLEGTRRQLTDVAKSFLQTIIATGGTNRYQLNYAPVKAESILVHVNGVDVSHEVAVEEHTGVLIFTVLEHNPKKDDVIAASGVHFRFFTDSELAKICQDATEMHVGTRADVSGRGLTLANISVVEDLPLQILCAIQAIYVLLTDAAFDIDINAPDGVNIPRSQRYRQLMELLQALEARYKDLSALLGVGLYAVEVFTLRRTSRRTERLVPIYIPMEINDHSKPKQIYFPAMLQGSIPVYSGSIGSYDWDVITGDPVSALFDFDFDLTGCVVENRIAPAPVGPMASGGPPVNQFTQTVVDAANGQMRLSLTGVETRTLPYNSYWEMQVRRPGETESRTKVRGMVRASNNEIVRGDPNAVPIP